MNSRRNETDQHPPVLQLQAFSAGKLVDSDLAKIIEEHVEKCDSCLALMQGIETNGLEDQLRQLELNEDRKACSADRYELLEEIGRGGAGVVYRARKNGLDRDVALKMLLSGTHAGVAELARFRRESAALSRLSHPQIVQVYDYGELDGAPYLALEFINGPSLADRLNRGPLDPMVAARWLRLLADAVDCAHRAGVMHRDLKPQNILLAPIRPSDDHDGNRTWRQLSVTPERIEDDRWTPKLVDFGLAHCRDGSTFRTKTGETLGTPSYLAPESIGGSAKNEETLVDIYGLGAVLYECLTGRPPFTGSTSWEILEAVSNRDPASISSLRSGVPLDLITICTRCLEKRPERRFATAGHLAEDLQRMIEQRPIRSRRVGRLEKSLRWARRRPATAVASLLGLSLAVAIPLLLLAQNRAVQQERNLARQQYAAARDTLHQLLATLNEDQATQIPEATRLAARQAEHALGLFEQLAQVDGSPEADLDLGKVLLVKGAIDLSLGKLDEATDCFHRAEELYQRYVGLFHFGKDAVAGLFEVHNKRALLYTETKQFDLAWEQLQTAEKLLQQLQELTDDDGPDSPSQRWRRHEWLRRNQGNVAYYRRDWEAASQFFSEALELGKQLRESGETLPSDPRDEAGLRINLASTQLQMNQWEESETNYREAISDLESWAATHAQDSAWMENWSAAILNQSNLLVALGKKEEAFLALQSAREKLKVAIQKDSGRHVLRLNLFMITANRAMYCPHPERLLECWRDAVADATNADHIIFSRQMVVRVLAGQGEVQSALSELLQIDAQKLDDQQRFVQASCHALLAKAAASDPTKNLLELSEQCAATSWELLQQLEKESLLNEVRREHLKAEDEWSRIRGYAGEPAWEQLIRQ